jgi:ABC-type uncharacterized transport system substrate-binding protein
MTPAEKTTPCFLLLGLVIAALACTSPAHCKSQVLILHSYHAGYDWVSGINSTLESGLQAAGVAAEFFYMDTKRRTDPAWKRNIAEQARQHIDATAPAIVIAIDDNAQQMVVRHYAGRSPIQFVVAGVNGDPAAYGFPADNVTGILERTYPDQVLAMLHRIVPSVRRVAWVSDDSPTADLVRQQVMQQARKQPYAVPIEQYRQPSTLESWKAAIRRIDSDPLIDGLLIPVYHTVKDPRTGKSTPPADVMAWTVANTRKPVVGLWAFAAEDGALCAVAVDPAEHGRVAALAARQILKGKKAGELPLTVNREGFVILNLVAAARLGIEVPFEIIMSAHRVIETSPSETSETE